MENAPQDPTALATAHAADPRPAAAGPRSLDGVTSFMGLRWDDPQTVRLTIRPELINNGGLLSGVVTYALVDYCMGSTLWAQTTEQERIATISIAINYIQTWPYRHLQAGGFWLYRAIANRMGSHGIAWIYRPTGTKLARTWHA